MAKKQRKDSSDKTESLTNIIKEYNIARLGMDMDSSAAQIAKGKLSYALNAVVENFDANSINYQNEPGNIYCLDFPEDYVVIGRYFINEQYKHIFFLTNPITGGSQIGYMVNNDCVYRIIVNDPCLGFNINFPIHKVVHKITNCSTEIYWADNVARRYLDIDNPPMKLLSGTVLCDPVYSDQIDCNQLKVQPNFTVPSLEVTRVNTGGSITSGTYQFAVQYADAVGQPLTSYYSITNPCPANDPFTVSVNYNTPVGKSITVEVGNLDSSGLFGYFNLAVIETINNISTPYLVGTYSLPGTTKEITYTGANEILTQLAMADIVEKFPYYEQANDVTTARDVLIWKGLTTIDRINYQSIASKITLDWETHRIPADESYADELNATNMRGYLRDEVYPFEIVFILTNGRQTDGFHIPGREITWAEETQPDESTANPDFIGEPDRMVGMVGYSPYWKIYNTATVTETYTDYTNSDDKVNYKGKYQYGKFSYWESSEEYPCNDELWGDLAGKKIRHHKFPDVNVSPINESSLFTTSAAMVMEDNAVFPIGVKIDLVQINSLIKASNLTQEQKDEIAGIKIIRGDRGTNKSIIGKGILRNVGKYEREEEEYYFPNYPYNDITEDPFLNKVNNAFSAQCLQYIITAFPSLFSSFIPIKVTYTSCENNKTITDTETIIAPGTYPFCSIGFPTLEGGLGTVAISGYDVWEVSSTGICQKFTVEWINIYGETQQYEVEGAPFNGGAYLQVYPGTEVKCISGCGHCGIHITGPIDSVESPFPLDCKKETPLEAISTLDTKRQIFNSPETSFGQPFLGNILKLESVLFGAGKAHFVEVKKNAKYKLLTKEGQQDVIDSSEEIGLLTDPFNPLAFFTVYQAYLEIFINRISRKNFAYSYNSIASYNYNETIPNSLGIKQRNLELSRYLIPGVQSIGEDTKVNNYNRESSVFLKMEDGVTDLPFPKDSTNIVPLGVEDKSRTLISEVIDGKGGCEKPAEEKPISVVSYYASMKNMIANQWGQIYSYITVDTGFQKTINAAEQYYTIFGGDTFISKFAFKTKLPFFIDNRVNGPDDSDIFYDEIGNVAYPVYWHSARSILEDVVISSVGTLPNFLSYKAHNFDCPNDQSLGSGIYDNTATIRTDSNPNRTFYDGYYYLFAYGVPSFYCESSYNLDLRQAFNSREGEFWPHVSTSIPDDWVQEDYVSIAYDNTYKYNVTYSKQNKEDSFTNLPANWSDDLCYTHFPFRAIYSDVSSSLSQKDEGIETTNNWLIYRAISYFDFPQNYGKFTSIDGIEDKAILARFENKTLLYNKLLTIDTSNPQAAYLGNDKLFSNSPPIDFADTDLGFVGTQNKMLLKIPNGQVTVDAKRGQIFLLNGTQVEIISKYGSGMNSFLKEHLPYKLLKHFPETKTNVDGEIITIPGVNIDNNFNGVGLHGVYDNRFDRIIITKIDYIPLSDDILFNPTTQEFYIEGLYNTTTILSLTDPIYFCNKSFTLSFNLNTKSWISFHSYIPNFYVAENNFFYSAKNDCCANFDFDFIAGEIVPNPSTTTTTTEYRVICTPFMGEAIELYIKDCTLEGSISLTDCILEGTGNVTVVPTTTTTTTAAPTTTTTTAVPTTTTTTTAGPTTTTTTTIASPTTTTTTSFSPTTTTTTTISPSTTTTTTVAPTTTTTTTISPTTTTTTTVIVCAPFEGNAYENVVLHFDDYIIDLKVDSDCNLGVYGNFRNYGLDGSMTLTGAVLKIDRCGTLDTSWTTNFGTGLNETAAYQNQGIAFGPDNSMYIGGWFTTVNGSSSPYFVKLQPDGTIDTSFDVGTGFSTYTNIPFLDTDGSVYVAGYFTTYKGVSSPRLIKLDQNGDKITAFNVGSGFDHTVEAVIEAGSNQIWVQGYFTTYKGVSANHIALLNKADATRDVSFQTGTGPNNATVNKPMTMAATDDGGVIVVSSYSITSYNGTGIGKNIFKLDRTGALDAAFMANVGTGFDTWVYSVLNDNGKFLIGGEFTTYDGVAVPYFIRLNADGTLDGTFNYDLSYPAFYNNAVKIGDYYFAPIWYHTYLGNYHAAIVRIAMDGTSTVYMNEPACNDVCPTTTTTTTAVPPSTTTTTTIAVPSTTTTTTTIISPTTTTTTTVLPVTTTTTTTVSPTTTTTTTVLVTTTTTTVAPTTTTTTTSSPTTTTTTSAGSPTTTTTTSFSLTTTTTTIIECTPFEGTAIEELPCEPFTAIIEPGATTCVDCALYLE